MNQPPRPKSILSTEYAENASALPVIYWPDKRLEMPCQDVEESEFDDELKTFVVSMLMTMSAEDGVGLAAPQVGVLKNIITISIPLEMQLPTQGTETPETQPVESPFVLINPVIAESSIETFKWDEGCLSVPGYFEERERSREIIVDFYNDDGKKHTEMFTGLYAFAIQHEIDHLHGKVFVEGLSRLKQDRIKKKIKKTLNRRM